MLVKVICEVKYCKNRNKIGECSNDAIEINEMNTCISMKTLS